jgi:hypothetical protein
LDNLPNPRSCLGHQDKPIEINSKNIMKPKLNLKIKDQIWHKNDKLLYYFLEIQALKSRRERERERERLGHLSQTGPLTCGCVALKGRCHQKKSNDTK